MRLKSLHHVHMVTTDLDKDEEFARDFGLITGARTNNQIFMQTLGRAQYSYVAELGDQSKFRGLGFLVDSIEDLKQAISEHGASPIVALDRPGGGHAVTLTDPQGTIIELIANIDEKQAQPGDTPLTLNHPGAYTRLNASQSERDLGPAKLFRLGHVGIYTAFIDVMIAWYRDVLGLLPTDTLHEPGSPENRVLSFMRLNRGEEAVDHHCLALARSGGPGCHHISFEAQDFEAQFRSHRWLLEKGYHCVAGVGRHGQGSHVFDTWFNWDKTSRWETYSDTDYVTEEFGTFEMGLNESELDIWGVTSLESYFMPPHVMRQKGLI